MNQAEFCMREVAANCNMYRTSSDFKEDLREVLALLDTLREENAEITKLKAEIADMKARWIASEEKDNSKILELGCEVERLQAENSKIRGEAAGVYLDAANAENDAKSSHFYKSQCTLLLEEISGLQSKISGMEDYSKEVLRLKSENAAVKTECDSLLSEHQRMRKEITRLNALNANLCEEIKKLTQTHEPKRRVFFRTESTDGQKWYAGDVDRMDELIVGIGHLLRAEIENSEECVDFTLSFEDMTDAEIDALPSL